MAFKTGSLSAIGASPLPLAAAGTTVSVFHYVTVKAAYGNTGRVYVGLAGVTAGGGPTTDGYELSAGDETPPLSVNDIPSGDLSNLYCVADGAMQKVYYAVVYYR